MTFPPLNLVYIYIWNSYLPRFVRFVLSSTTHRQDLVQILKVEPGETLSSDSLAVGGFLANMTDGIHGTKKGWYIYRNMKTHKNQL